MTNSDFDITFCPGSIKVTEDNVETTFECPLRKHCNRYWDDYKASEAIRLGCIYNSFFILDDPSILEGQCKYFWEK